MRLALAILASWNFSPASTAAAVSDPLCLPQAAMRFICKVELAEDSLAIPKTEYLVTGVLGFAGTGGLQLVSTRTHQVSRLFPAPTVQIRPHARYADCAVPPANKDISIGGLALVSLGPRRHLLYATNTGGRKSIEIFELQTSNQHTPTVSWIGCVILPADTNPNAVTALRSFGMAIVSMDDDGPERWSKHINGIPSGRVYEWQPRTSLNMLPGLQLRAGNGIAASRDARWLYVSAWAGSELVVIDRYGKQASKHIPLPFLPDNLRWSRDGQLWVTGQRSTVAQIARCTGNPCMADWLVAKIDPRNFSLRIVIEARGSDAVNYATGVAETGDTLYITNRGMNRLGIVSIASKLTTNTLRVDASTLP
jgi:hypothetical protein